MFILFVGLNPLDDSQLIPVQILGAILTLILSCQLGNFWNIN